jgi:hypothetical protein
MWVCTGSTREATDVQQHLHFCKQSGTLCGSFHIKREIANALFVSWDVCPVSAVQVCGTSHV